MKRSLALAKRSYDVLLADPGLGEADIQEETALYIYRFMGIFFDFLELQDLCKISCFDHLHHIGGRICPFS